MFGVWLIVDMRFVYKLTDNIASCLLDNKYIHHLEMKLTIGLNLLSVSVAKERWLKSITFEVDKNVLTLIKDKFDNVKVIEADLREKSSASLEVVKTFIADPPYTLHGAMLFTYKGLQLLRNDDQIKEFYLVLNPTMLGSFMNDFLRNLSDIGVWLHEVYNNFSQYELPEKFEERNRANEFLKQNNIDERSLSYSSSSNLYIFRTINPNLDKLWNNIDLELIYKHFI